MLVLRFCVIICLFSRYLLKKAAHTRFTNYKALSAVKCWYFQVGESVKSFDNYRITKSESTANSVRLI